MIDRACGGLSEIGQTSLEDLRVALRGKGLWLDYGAVVLRVQSEGGPLAEQVRAVYPRFPFATAGPWADLHVRIARARGIRRWFRPQSLFFTDGGQPFLPFPADSPLPLMEWGSNWLIGQQRLDYLLLHAGVVERNGGALILPALPGSGKSTLAAALSLSGWRLLSDEFGVYDPEHDCMRALLKPVALKNESIGVIRNLFPAARLGPAFPKTRKGTVAHLAAGAEAVARRHEPAAPTAVIFPRWQRDAETRLVAADEERVFRALAFNAFNYTVLGEVGFRAAISLVRRCPAWELTYSRLDEAIAAIDSVWPLAKAPRQPACTPDEALAAA